MFRRTEPSHTVELIPGTRLHGLLGGTLGVNSFHHQAVDRIAPGFLAAAKSPDGVIEAIEPERSGRFVLGVQWHPEMMALAQPEQLRLMQAFVDACRG